MPKGSLLTILLILIIFNALDRAQCDEHVSSNSSSSSWLAEEADNANQTNVVKAMQKLRSALVNISNQFDVSIVTLRNCMQMQCMVYCFYGHYSSIERDIQLALNNTENPTHCDYFDELRFYNYEFPNEILPADFLGKFAGKVYTLYIGCSNITRIEAGAFGEGVFRNIILEELQIVELDKSFFEAITSHFESLTIIQRNADLHYINSNFLYHVKYQIKSLTLHAGIDSLHNLTGADNLLNKLSFVDFRYNNFSTTLSVNSFYQLSMVEYIDLSYCEIEFIPDYIFNRMKSTLLSLNLSNNKLKTLSTKIFDWSEMSRNLKINAESNPWHCNCEFMLNMTEIFVYQLVDLYCVTPPEYESMLVFSTRFCDDENGHSSGEETEQPQPTSIATSTTTTTEGTTSITSAPTVPTTTVSKPPTVVPTVVPTLGPQTPTSPANPTMPPEMGIASLECAAGTIGGSSLLYKGSENTQYVRWPNLTFFARANANYAVKITLRLDEGCAEESYGLFWFCKTTSEYYKMELMPDIYGLGCYGKLPYETIVENLMPDVAYTFCLVGPNQSEVSPFDCKSVHIGGNMTITYSSWRAPGVRATRISLLVFGIVLFLYCGILAVFLLLKHKPALLKGNKRIMTPNCSTGEIVVLPKNKTVDQMKQKEAILAKSQHNRGISCIRRSSLASVASTESYINTNLYECIPAYLELEDMRRPKSNDYFEIYDSGGQKHAKDAQPSISCASSSHRTLHVNYAEVPRRTKRASSDPLPELPECATKRSLPVLARVSDASAEYTDLAIAQV